jgi:hypothetical protein
MAANEAHFIISKWVSSAGIFENKLYVCFLNGQCAQYDMPFEQATAMLSQLLVAPSPGAWVNYNLGPAPQGPGLSYKKIGCPSGKIWTETSTLNFDGTTLWTATHAKTIIRAWGQPGIPNQGAPGPNIGHGSGGGASAGSHVLLTVGAQYFLQIQSGGPATQMFTFPGFASIILAASGGEVLGGLAGGSTGTDYNFSGGNGGTPSGVTPGSLCGGGGGSGGTTSNGGNGGTGTAGLAGAGQGGAGGIGTTTIPLKGHAPGGGGGGAIQPNNIAAPTNGRIQIQMLP